MKEFFEKLFKKFTSLWSQKEGSGELKKETANTKAFIWMLVIVIVLALVFTFFGKPKEKVVQNILESDLKDQRPYARVTLEVGSSKDQKFLNLADKMRQENAPETLSSSKKGFGKKSSSSQIISNNEKGAFSVPKGTVFKVMLSNKIVSNSLNQPVIAIVDSPFYYDNTLAIDRSSKLIGRASHDEMARRVKIKFDSLVTPDGEEKNISALALDLGDDGSLGLSGKYHSNTASRTAGTFLSYFVSGFTQGLKDKKEGYFGDVDEGSVKNGVLEGVSRVSHDQAKRFSESLEKTKGFIEIPPGYEFLVFLDQEFNYE